MGTSEDRQVIIHPSTVNFHIMSIQIYRQSLISKKKKMCSQGRVVDEVEVLFNFRRLMSSSRGVFHADIEPDLLQNSKVHFSKTISLDLIPGNM
jgi:hypothetical protein